MFNVLIDSLPYEFNGKKIYPYHDVGIQISQLIADKSLTNNEKIVQAVNLLFEDPPESLQEAEKGIEWFLNGWSTDRHKKKGKEEPPVMDFDRDQWRIWAAIKQQYGIDLAEEAVHWWVFMGMISNLDECAFTNVIELRQKKVDSKMSRETKKAIREAQAIYGLIADNEPDEQEQEAIARFRSLQNKSRQEPESSSQREPFA